MTVSNNWLATKSLKIGTDSPEKVQLQHTNAPKPLSGFWSTLHTGQRRWT